MKYTNSKEADKKIEQDMKIIQKRVLERYRGKIKAIIIFGGFGKGEGSFRKEGKKIFPLNDYDLYLISDKQISGEELEKLGRECSSVLGYGGVEIVEDFNKKYDEKKCFHVDLHCIQESNLKKLYPTQRTFDLKNSQVVYGNKKILKEIPNVEISKSDAIRVLFNKMNHFLIAENNSEILKSIYAVKGFLDLASALLIFRGKYVSSYSEKLKVIKGLEVPQELKKNIEKAVKAKLNSGYRVTDVNNFFEESKKWVEWTLKKILREHMNIKSEDWEIICKETYKKLPYIYFNDYLGSRFLFWGQYYLNLKFFLAGKRKEENLSRSLLRWRDSGVIIALSLVLYFCNEKEEAERYLKKLTKKTHPLRERILKLYSIYYLQKLI